MTHQAHQAHQHVHSDGGSHHDHVGRGGRAKTALREVFAPHTHDAADSIDDALESSAAGIRAVKISLVVLGVTALAQLVIVAISGSVALLADTIHNFSDALTAIPLWIAFVLGRRAATRRYTYGFGRAEDLAGLFVIAMIALSAAIAAYESVRRLILPVPIDHVGWVAAAGFVGFIGNELIAIYRIRVGRRIGSAALVADGLHARTDGFTSLAVLLGAGGVALGFPWPTRSSESSSPSPSSPFYAPRRATCSADSSTVWTPNSSTPPKPRLPPNPASQRYAASECAGSATAYTPTPNSTSTPPSAFSTRTRSPTTPNTPSPTPFPNSPQRSSTPTRPDKAPDSQIHRPPPETALHGVETS